MKNYLRDANLSYFDMGVMACFRYRNMKDITLKKFYESYQTGTKKELRKSFNRLVKYGYLKREVKSLRTVVYNLCEN